MVMIMPGDKQLPPTGLALLGLLSLGGELSGYELKRRADKTLRFFWISPAMSQVYTELERLERYAFVSCRDVHGPGRRQTRRFAITAAGEQALRAWMRDSEPEFPVLKHSVVLRLFLGHLTEPERTCAMLAEYAARLRERIEELEQIREALREDPPSRYPDLVAEWGQRYYRMEIDAVDDIVHRLDPDNGS